MSISRRANGINASAKMTPVKIRVLGRHTWKNWAGGIRVISPNIDGRSEEFAMELSAMTISQMCANRELRAPLPRIWAGRRKRATPVLLFRSNELIQNFQTSIRISSFQNLSSILRTLFINPVHVFFVTLSKAVSSCANRFAIVKSQFRAI